MLTIDADAHVVECDETWGYLEGRARDFAPTHVVVPDGKGGQRTVWAIDGHLASTGPVSETDAVKSVREMSDVAGRVKQMDELATDVQVLYPTIFLRPITTKPWLEEALCRSYNRWLADRCAKAPDRLKWAVIPPTMTIGAAIDEIRFGHENGASAVFWRGFENGRLPTDPYFEPILEEMNRLGIAMGLHAANGTFELHDMFPEDTGIWRFKVPGITAFQCILATGLAKKYPNIRFGFVELQAQWVPYVLTDFVRREGLRGRDLDPSALMAEHHLYVACQTDDDLAYILRFAGTENLVMGTDFGHADISSELRALQILRERADVDSQYVENILGSNAQALYGLK